MSRERCSRIGANTEGPHLPSSETTYHGEAVLAVLTAPFRMVARLIETPLLKAVGLPFRRAMVCVAVFNYWKTPIGPYNELVYAVPVYTQTRYRFRPLLLPSRGFLNKLGFYMVSIVTNTPAAIQEMQRLGFPIYDRCLSVNMVENGEDFAIGVKDDKRSDAIFLLRGRKPKKDKFECRTLTTYHSQASDLFRVRIGVQARVGTCPSLRIGAIWANSHESIAFPNGLNDFCNCMELAYYKELVLTLHPFEKVAE